MAFFSFPHMALNYLRFSHCPWAAETVNCDWWKIIYRFLHFVDIRSVSYQYWCKMTLFIHYFDIDGKWLCSFSFQRQSKITDANFFMTDGDFRFFFQKYLYALFSEGSSDIWFQHLEWTYALISSTWSYKYKGHLPLDLWNTILFNLRDTQSLGLCMSKKCHGLCQVWSVMKEVFTKFILAPCPISKGAKCHLFVRKTFGKSWEE